MVETESLLQILSHIGNETQKLNSDDDHAGSGHGRISFKKVGKHTFICEFCGEPFSDIVQIENHLVAKHLGPDEQISTSQEVVENNKTEDVIEKFETEDVIEKIETEDPVEKMETGDVVEYIETEDVVEKISMEDVVEKNETEDAVENETEDAVEKIETEENYGCPDSKMENSSLDPSEDDIIVVIEIANDEEPPVDQSAIQTSQNTHSCDIQPDEIFQIICEFCTDVFRKDRHFREHVVTHHGNLIPKVLKGDTTYLTCEWCDQQCETPLERYEHEQKKHKCGDLFLCPLCPKTYKVHRYLRYHLNGHKGIGIYACSHCPRTFTVLNALQSHIRCHRRVQLYSCDYCDKQFHFYTEKVDHAKTHSNLLPYRCEKCGLQFEVKRDLDSHLDTHKIKCDECGKKFQTYERLKNHQNLHVRHKCKFCNKWFEQKAALHHHMKLHRI